MYDHWVYAATTVAELKNLWREIMVLHFAFDLSMFVVGDFNETMFLVKGTTVLLITRVLGVSRIL